jgi:hypothetical protein
MIRSATRPIGRAHGETRRVVADVRALVLIGDDRDDFRHTYARSPADRSRLRNEQ